jgi:hypothetical protein
MQMQASCKQHLWKVGVWALPSTQPKASAVLKVVFAAVLQLGGTSSTQIASRAAAGKGGIGSAVLNLYFGMHHLHAAQQK